MEVEFKKTTIPCLEVQLWEVQNSEQTLEIKLSEGMPEVGSVVAAWGQVVLRGKQWQADRIRLSGGVMVWVLYAPEDGSQPRTIEGWMPFQMHWDLPPECREGTIRVATRIRGIDARPVSARRILVRAGVGAMAQALGPCEAEVYSPQEESCQVELLKKCYPLTLMKEAGEKAFLLEEELMLPESAPGLDSLVYCRLEPKILEQKVLGDKLVFRGSGCCHILYRCREGQLHSWEFQLPFSHYAELTQTHSTQAQSQVLMELTALEPEVSEGRLRMKGAVTAQYLITDRQLLELTEDAYLPGQDTTAKVQLLEIPSVLDQRILTQEISQQVSAQADVLVDSLFLPDFPMAHSMPEGVQLELSGSFQTLYYQQGGSLRSVNTPWQAEQKLAAGDNTQLMVLPCQGEARGELHGENLSLEAQLLLQVDAVASQQLPMVTGVELGQCRPWDPSRPSVILRRAGEESLWDIAKANDTRVETIRKANGLEEEPDPQQILLIPVGL